MIRKLLLLCALGAMLATGTPAVAAPRVQVVTDGFTVSGLAGSQTVLRFPRPWPLVTRDGRSRPSTVRASSGAMAGAVLVSLGPRSGTTITLFGATPRWTCGADSCGTDAVLGGSCDGACAPYTMAPGDYLLVLVGSPGARLDIVTPPLARKARPVRVAPGPVTPPVSYEAAAATAGTGVEPVIEGRFEIAPLPHAGFVVMMHGVAMEQALSRDSRLGFKAPLADACAVDGVVVPGGPPDEEYAPPGRPGPSYRTAFAFARVLPGDPLCAYWSGTVHAAKSRQRVVALHFAMPSYL